MPRKAYLALAVAACLVGGCGPKPAAKYRIAVIPKGLTHEFWQSIHRGARRAADDLTRAGTSVEVLWDGPRKESDAQEQISLVQQKAGMNIHGLVLAPQDSKGMVPVVEETVDKGIPVVIIDSGLDPEALEKRPDLIVKYVATDNENGGRLAAKHLLDVLTKEGCKEPKLILFRYAVGSESTEKREKGFMDVVKAKPGVEVISDNKYAGPTVDSAQAEAGPLLERLGLKADGIFAVNESSTVGLLNVLRNQRVQERRKEAGLPPLRVMGFDASEPLLQSLREGELDGTIVQDPYRMGYLGVWTLVQHLEGHDVRAGGRDFSTGENLITRANLDKDTTRGLFDAEVQKKRTIKTPEYKKKGPS
jgi:ribose transport system substrate-binding protein